MYFYEHHINSKLCGGKNMVSTITYIAAAAAESILGTVVCTIKNFELYNLNLKET
jgi:hypothetical protein